MKKTRRDQRRHDDAEQLSVPVDVMKQAIALLLFWADLRDDPALVVNLLTDATLADVIEHQRRSRECATTLTTGLRNRKKVVTNAPV